MRHHSGGGGVSDKSIEVGACMLVTIWQRCKW